MAILVYTFPMSSRINTFTELQINLSPCRILRTLRFDCRHERGAVPDWTWLVWLLSHLTCRTLRTIAFAFESSSHALASMHTFAEELDRVLTSALFSDGLDSVVFDFDYSDVADPDDKRFFDMFPALRDSRLLRGTFSRHCAVPSTLIMYDGSVQFGSDTLEHSLRSSAKPEYQWLSNRCHLVLQPLIPPYCITDPVVQLFAPSCLIIHELIRCHTSWPRADHSAARVVSVCVPQGVLSPSGCQALCVQRNLSQKYCYVKSCAGHAQ